MGERNSHRYICPSSPVAVFAVLSPRGGISVWQQAAPSVYIYESVGFD